ncbi:MAG: TetR/AcrR family transcriptional regulator [Oscillospiraceae bacterium]|nr:TetR/AcrR family transcriptional regulator [Oscillospiraceae bacterium]
MDGFVKRRNDKKDSIVRAAMELFVQYGFERVTMTEIAEKARVSKVSIYNFFESKDNLRRVIAQDIMDASLARTAEIVRSDVCFDEKIREYLSRRTVYAEHGVYNFFFEAVEGDGTLRRRLDEFSAANELLILQLIKEGKDAGRLAPNISNDAIEIYIDIFQSYVLCLGKEKLNRYKVTPALTSEINQLFLDGLLRKG